MLQRTTYLEILREVVLPIDAEHTLALHAVFRVRLQRHVDARTGINDTLVQNGHLAGRIVHRIVGALLQDDATCRHLDRPLRHVVGAQRDDVGRGTLELSHQQVLVLVGHLLGRRPRGVIEFLEGILVSHGLAQARPQEEAFQRRAERLGRREEHAAVGHRIAFHKVEHAIGVGLVIVVQAVAAQASQQGDTFHLRYISKVYTCGITLELDVEPELGLLDRRSQIVDVLHHQRPVGLLRIIRRILQRLDEQGLTGIGMVAGKLAHPVGTPAIGVLEGYGQDLVGLQAGL